MFHVAEQARLIAGVDVGDDVAGVSPSAVFRRVGMGYMVCCVVDVVGRTRRGGKRLDGLADGAGARAAGRVGAEATMAGSTAGMEPSFVEQTEAAYGVRDLVYPSLIEPSWMDVGCHAR